MAYLGKTPSQAVRSRYYFTATGGETSLSGADDSGKTLVFADGNYVDVTLNGVTLVAGTDYNTTTANTIGGLTALTASDVVEIVVYDTFSVFSGNVNSDFTVGGSITTDGLTTTGDINFGDNDKAVFGAGSDLQIYHDASNSYIKDAGTGDLLVQGTQIKLQDASGNDYLRGFTGGAVYLHHAGNTKFETNATGVDVVGTAKSDIVQLDAGSAPTWDTNTRLWSESGFGARYDGYQHRFDVGVSRTEAMRITASGNVGIGTSSPSVTLDTRLGTTTGKVAEFHNSVGYGIGFTVESDGGVNTINSEGNQALAFATNGASNERVRIDTSGNLLVGYGGQTTTAFGQPQGMTIGSLDNVALQYYLRKGNQVEARIGFKASTDTNFYVGSGGGTGSGGIGVYGVYLTNLGNSWNSVSDETQKTIVENIENASEKVSTLRTVMGHYNNDENETRRPFLIAQDVQAVLPEAVSVADIETGILGLSYTDVIPLLTAAIKEQRETINSLEARITALEAV